MDKVESDMPAMPADFWNYGFNPVTGWKIYKTGNGKLYKAVILKDKITYERH